MAFSSKTLSIVTNTMASAESAAKTRLSDEETTARRQGPVVPVIKRPERPTLPLTPVACAVVVAAARAPDCARPLGTHALLRSSVARSHAALRPAQQQSPSEQRATDVDAILAISKCRVALKQSRGKRQLLVALPPDEALPPDATALPAPYDGRRCSIHCDESDNRDDDREALADYPTASPAKENAEPTASSSSGMGWPWARRSSTV